jgi:hypothetical protein
MDTDSDFLIFKAPDKYLPGAFSSREFLAQLAQLLCQNFPMALQLDNLQIAKHTDFTKDFRCPRGWHFPS